MSVSSVGPTTATSVATGGFPAQTTTTVLPFPGFAPVPPRPVGVDPVSDYEARAAVHALMANGVSGMANWFRQVLFNPNNSDRANFLNSPERVQWFKNLAIKDLISGFQKYGAPVFTGDALKEAIRKTYWQATGVDALRNIFAGRPSQPVYIYPTSQADLAGINKQMPDARTPAGIAQISQNLGGSGLDALKYNLWGHAASVNKVIDNQSISPFLRDGLTNPQSRDFGLIQGTPGGTNYVQALLANPQAGNQINLDFLGTLSKIFGIQFGH